MTTISNLKRTLTSVAWLAVLLALVFCQTVSAQDLDETKYTVLDTPMSVSTGDKIEVTELFWYGCGHCFALEPFVKSWLEDKPENAEFVKVPAIFSSSWAFHGKAYYTMEALGVLDEANDAFFHQIHVVRKPISNLESLITFLQKYGKSEQEVTAAFNSFAVDTKLRNATKITRESTATGVPAILVDGKYQTSVSLAGGQAELFDVINQLVAKAASER
ncbi:thiol:disulfide interchange protein DsbA/DsbL [Arenicella sp.]|nr:thiol:disulfide interchange protein DsbA/DsbL [Arenicella sp.]